MNKILDRWYMTIFIIPIVLTYSTNYLTLPDIFSNWQYSIIVSLFIIIGILLYEIFLLKRQIEHRKIEPKRRDKEIINDLLSTLNLDVFHEDIYEQNAWYGYKKEAISNIIDFTSDVRLIKNKTSDKELNSYLENFTNKLKDFQEYSAVRLFGETNFYMPNKDSKEAKKIAEIETKKMNELTKESFLELEKLMQYLREKEYV